MIKHLHEEVRLIGIGLPITEEPSHTTRHSTTTAIAKELGKDRARKFSGHNTDKAFDRYCQIVDEDTFDSAQIMAKIRGKMINLNHEEAISNKV